MKLTATFWFRLLCLSTCGVLISPVFAAENCNFPAIFNLGDSNSDTGASAASIAPITKPYGETYFHMPAGRLSDGRLIIDFMAKSFGFSYLSAYLDSLASNFSHGANFAVASSTIAPHEIDVNAGRFSPFYLDIQYTQLTEFKLRSQRLRKEGGWFVNLLPKKEYFSQALYTFDMGQNDISRALLANMSMADINTTVNSIVKRFSDNVKNVYDIGGRSFWIHNTGPVGCLPYFLTNVPVPESQKDSVGCARIQNDIAQYFNYKLKEAVVQLRKDLPLAAITYVDIYTVKYSLYAHPEKHGFVNPLVACCGYGGKYNFSNIFWCGTSTTINGKKVFIGSCDNPSVRVVWDGVHYTEAANKYVFSQIATGSFSDPPNTPPNMACQKSSN